MAKDKKTIKYEADISGFKKNIEIAEKNIKTLNNTLKLNQAQLKGNKESTELLSQRIATLKQKYEEQITVVENTRKTYEKAVEIYGENSTEAENLKNKLLQVETRQQSIANTIDQTNKQLIIQSEKFINAGESISKFGENISTVGDKLDKAGNKLSVLSAGIAAVATVSLKSSIDFESAWTGVTKTVDGTDEQLRTLREGILDLSTKLPSTAKEIAGVAENAGQLGIATDDILDFTKVMIDLGNSTNLSADEASSALAKFANITKMSTDDYDRLGSTIVALGNNFATTEADIVNMATNLASTGELTGLTQAQILALAAAMSSVGIEAEAGGSAMSKLLKKIQVAVEIGGQDLTNFSKIAGMTSSEFKKAFQDDAVGALSSFISGLNDTERNGKSAIAILNDMGLTEVRLSNTVLSLANASDMMSNAVRMAGMAWSENTALSEEATKRYETTESKLKKMKNEIIASSIALGDELKPSLLEVMENIKPLISNVSNAVKSFNNLSESTKKNITGFVGVVAAMGPALKIGGKLTTTTGNMISGYGKLVKKAGEWSAKLKIATTAEALATTTKKAQTIATTSSTVATNTNTGAIVAQTTATTGATVATNLLKVAMIGLPIVGVVAGVASLVAMFSEMSNETTQTTNKIKEQKDAWEDLKQQQKEQLSANLSEVENVQRLRNELSSLVDENGRVKDGYEGRVNFILEELSNALGVEYKATEGIVEKYEELKGSIDDLIKKKKANAYLDSLQAGYDEAIQKKGEAIKQLNELEKTYYDDKEKLAQKEKELEEEKKKYRDVFTIANMGNLEREINELTEKTKAYEDQEKICQEYYKTIAEYEEAYGIVKSGNVKEIEELNKRLEYSYIQTGNNNIDTIKNNLEAEKTNLEQLKSVYSENQSEITKNQIEESEKRIKALEEEMFNATGVIQLGGENLVYATKEMAENAIYQLENSPTYREKALENLNGYLQGLTDEEKRKFLEQAGIENADLVISKLNKEGLAEEEGINILKGYYKGLTNQSWIKQITASLAGLGKKVTSTIKFNVPVATLTDGSHANGLDYVPFDGYIAELHKGERVLTAEENKKYNNENIDNKVTNSTIILNVYPQKMDESETERIFRYIDREYGKYR